MAVQRLCGHIRTHDSLAINSIVGTVSYLTRVYNRRLHSNRRIRVRKLNCFTPALRTARGIAHDAPGGRLGLQLGDVDFHPSIELGRTVAKIDTVHDGCAHRSLGLSRIRVSVGLGRCFTSRSILVHDSFRTLYNVTHAATGIRLGQLRRRNGLGGMKGPARPVCQTVPKCCNISHSTGTKQ